MDAEQFRELCLAQNGAVEEPPFFKVHGKVFAIVAPDAEPAQVGLKCDPALAEAFRGTYPAIRPGYHNQRHWNTVILDGTLPSDFVREMLEDSYDLVVAALPKRIQVELGWSFD